jgi:hypothetical protein
MNPTPTLLDAEPDVVPSLSTCNTPAAFYHQDSEAVRFWVSVADGFVGASIRTAVLRYHFNPDGFREEPIEIYARHAAELGAAVQRRVTLGSREPVMLREPDLRPDAGAGSRPA